MGGLCGAHVEDDLGQATGDSQADLGQATGDSQAAPLRPEGLWGDCAGLTSKMT